MKITARCSLLQILTCILTLAVLIKGTRNELDIQDDSVVPEQAFEENTISAEDQSQVTGKVKNIQIACPVLRALYGSGVIQDSGAEKYTVNAYTGANNLMSALKNVLGFTGKSAEAFEGAITALGPNAVDPLPKCCAKGCQGAGRCNGFKIDPKIIKAGATENQFRLDTLPVAFHSANTGILGETTAGGVKDKAINMGALRRMKQFTKRGDISPERWGKVVHMYASTRWKEREEAAKNNTVGLEMKPAHWVMILGELTNFKLVFCNKRIRGKGRLKPDNILYDTIRQVYVNGRLPKGYIHASDGPPSFQVGEAEQRATVKSMCYKIPKWLQKDKFINNENTHGFLPVFCGKPNGAKFRYCNGCR